MAEQRVVNGHLRPACRNPGPPLRRSPSRRLVSARWRGRGAPTEGQRWEHEMGEPPEEWREQLERALVGVEGWLAFDEAWALHESARLGPSSSVAEIGSHKGRSTIALALGLEARGCGKVLAIDPYDAEIDGESGAAPRAVFQANLRRSGVAHRVEQCRSYSHEAAEHVAAMSLGALFIDGSHEY